MPSACKKRLVCFVDTVCFILTCIHIPVTKKVRMIVIKVGAVFEFLFNALQPCHASVGKRIDGSLARGFFDNQIYACKVSQVAFHGSGS